MNLLDAQAMHLVNPLSFEVPSQAELREVEPGWYVKLGFPTGDRNIKIERMWVLVTERTPTGGRGELNNDPVLCNLECGTIIEYEDRHVLSIMRGD